MVQFWLRVTAVVLLTLGGARLAIAEPSAAPPANAGPYTIESLNTQLTELGYQNSIVEGHILVRIVRDGQVLTCVISVGDFGIIVQHNLGRKIASPDKLPAKALRA